MVSSIHIRSGISACCAILLCATTITHAQQVPEVPDAAALKSLPIDLDADSSEFDRKRNRLRFRGLRIRQGPLTIDADEATATRLDFENTRWEFNGNVRIENTGTTAWADNADILFKDHTVRSAAMTGAPVRFEQVAVDRNDASRVTTTEGRARVMEYDVGAGLISMTDDAWLSDGTNEVSGNRISYDLVREVIVADADDSGPVHMKIVPPEGELESRGLEMP